MGGGVNRLREIRLDRGLTLKDVAEAAQTADPRIDAPMVSKFESGVCVPTPNVAEAIFRTLQTTESDVYGTGDILYPLRQNPLKCVPAWVEAFAMHIPCGKASPISRQALCDKTGLSDRAVRKLISEARAYGYVILNDGDGRGYYQSDDIADIERQYNRETSRAMTILVARKVLREKLKEAGKNV